eukprot:8827064-Pyramimonas_sp.AAC.2
MTLQRVGDVATIPFVASSPWGGELLFDAWRIIASFSQLFGRRSKPALSGFKASQAPRTLNLNVAATLLLTGC